MIVHINDVGILAPQVRLVSQAPHISTHSDRERIVVDCNCVSCCRNPVFKYQSEDRVND